MHMLHVIVHLFVILSFALVIVLVFLLILMFVMFAIVMFVTCNATIYIEDVSIEMSIVMTSDQANILHTQKCVYY